MNKKLTILFAPINLVGPINASIGIGQVLKNSGHRVVFAIQSDWTAKLKIHGFEEQIIGNTVAEETEGSAKRNVEELESIFGPKSRLEKLINLNKWVIKQEMDKIRENEPFLEDILKRIKPDVIFIDHILCLPSLMSSSIPWVLIMTCNPMCLQYIIDDPLLPPANLGLPTNGDPIEWQKLRQELDEPVIEDWTKFNDWIVSKGMTSLSKYKFMHPSPHLNIYIYPEELDYTDIRQLPPNFHRFDCFKRTGIEESFELPENLKNRSGKLIYLSLGSMGSGDVELMKKLVSILCKSKHRYIVSKGVNHDKYELGDNMWGHRYVPQIKVLPIVDLVITHGGNNTLTETMFFGKPFLVMPLFFDQFDNSQRIVEKGFGIELNPYECTENQLLESIDCILNDTKLAQKLKKVSQRIQTQQNILKISDLVQNIVK